MSAQRQHQREREMLQARDALLLKAGIDVERRMRMLNKAFTTIEEKLEAKKEVVTRFGDIIEVVDNQSNIRAAEAILDFEGVSLGKSNESGSHGPISIIINAPWFQPEHTIPSGQGQIVEGQAVQVVEEQEKING